MKKLIRNVFNKFGFELVKIKNLHDCLSKHLSNVIANKNIDCIIDVGANCGQYGEFLRELGYKGYIVSFEPVTSVYEKLKEKCESDSKWLCYKVALGDKNEEKNINVYENTVFSSFLQANDYSKKIWNSLKNHMPESVQVFRLDDIFDEKVGIFGCKNYMLKLDTQGYDKIAFEGAQGCMTNILALQSELSLISVYEEMDDAYEVLHEFHCNGFFISGMYPINRDKSLAVIEYDCVLVKRPFPLK